MYNSNTLQEDDKMKMQLLYSAQIARLISVNKN